MRNLVKIKGKVNCGSSKYSYILDVDSSTVYYDILDMEFKIEVKRVWFIFYFRRREKEKITRICETSVISVGSGEILNIPLLSLESQDKDLRARCNFIADLINSDIDIKQAILLRYTKDVEINYVLNVNNNSSYETDERFCGVEDVINKCFGPADNCDESSLDLEDCMIYAHKTYNKG